MTLWGEQAAGVALRVNGRDLGLSLICLSGFGHVPHWLFIGASALAAWALV
ncbi:MAG: hypothetical protein ACRCVV_15820 [Shewanella sp.]